MVGRCSGEEMHNATKEIRRMVRQDKREWKRTRVRKELNVKERWAGIRLLKED